MMISERAEVRRHLSAPPERGKDAFAGAEVVAQWLTPSPDVKLTVLELDFREGGAYRCLRHTQRSAHARRWDVPQIEAPVRLPFSWLIEPPDIHAGIESQVTVAIEPSGSGSDLLILHERFGRADANARHAEGWGGALDQLQRLISTR